jgi:hypothetical protein
MKVELKKNIDELQYLNLRLEASTKIDINDFTRLNRDSKLVASIMQEVADKICGKFEKISRRPSLFDGKKKYNTTLSYHQAYALWVYLTGAVNNETDPHRRTMAIKLHGKLDKHFL